METLPLHLLLWLYNLSLNLHIVSATYNCSVRERVLLTHSWIITEKSPYTFNLFSQHYDKTKMRVRFQTESYNRRKPLENQIESDQRQIRPQNCQEMCKIEISLCARTDPSSCSHTGHKKMLSIAGWTIKHEVWCIYFISYHFICVNNFLHWVRENDSPTTLQSIFCFC